MESDMEKISRGFEANIMAILDSAGVRHAEDADDDRHYFLDAVRSAYILSSTGNVPTRKIFEAIFQILKDATSLELKMISFQLLQDLNKCFPRVQLYHSELESPHAKTLELVVSEERFSLLIEGISHSLIHMNSQMLGLKILGDMILLQYLINFLEQDFLPRRTAYQETKKWAFISESLLHMLLSSRRISFKSFVKTCIPVMLKRLPRRSEVGIDNLKNDESSAKAVHDCGVSEDVGVSTPALLNDTCISMMKLFTLIMELDAVKKEADMLGLTSRADGTRTPLLEVILDELTYDKDLLSPFLQVFSDPKWKLEIVLQYFWKYCTKPSICTRRSNSSADDGSFHTVLKCFSTSASTRNVIRKIGAEVTQLLLAHAFQAYIFLHHARKLTCDMKNGSCSLDEICMEIISSFKSLQKVDEQMEIIHFGKEALFTAATILSAKSQVNKD